MQASAEGALSIDTMCQDGAFMIENISYYRDGKIATELSAEADWQRRGLYIGPQVSRHYFACLDSGC
jgi:complement component 1 Q subcomponent-binding protein